MTLLRVRLALSRSVKERLLSRSRSSRISLIRSDSEIRSVSISRRSSLSIRPTTCLKASMSSKRLTSIIASSGSSGTSSAGGMRLNTSRSSTLLWLRLRAASLKAWYSRSCRTSSARGSFSSSASPAPSSTGRSILDLMWMRVAASTRYSPARSRLRAFIISRCSRYCSVMRAMGML